MENLESVGAQTTVFFHFKLVWWILVIITTYERFLRYTLFLERFVPLVNY